MSSSVAAVSTKTKTITTTSSISSASSTITKKKLQEIVSNSSCNDSSSLCNAQRMDQSIIDTNISSTSTSSTILIKNHSIMSSSSSSTLNSSNLNLTNYSDNPSNSNQFNNETEIASTACKSHEFICNEQLSNDFNKITITESAANQTNSENIEQKSVSKVYLNTETDDIMEEENSEIIKKKKLSLTLPLLNVVVTDTANTSNDQASNGAPTEQSDNSCNKTKKFYESDDTFIQTIFSQTIKSTTATPTDDEQSYVFDAFDAARTRGSVASQIKSDSINTDDTPIEKVEIPIDCDSSDVLNVDQKDEIIEETIKNSPKESNLFHKNVIDDSELCEMIDDISPPTDRPAASFSYFHQTIEEDDQSSLNDNAELTLSPSNTSLTDIIDTNLQLLTDNSNNINYNNMNSTKNTNNDNTNINRITTIADASTQLLPSPSSSSVNQFESETTSTNGGGGGVIVDDDGSDDNDNTNAIYIENEQNSADQINAADLKSSYDEHTEQNNSFTSNNTSLHSSVDRTDSRNGTEEIITTSEKSSIKKKSSDSDGLTSNGKKKSKKSKKSDSEKENISVRSSFNKFDALQKQNIANVRSGDAVKLHGSEVDKVCHSCSKIVYKMEEMKAEKCIWHKNCFRCCECSKPLSVDTYQSHEGILYCKPHFKSLFSPKAVEDSEPDTPRKPEVIIRESQPIELPPDVIRSSDKTDLGLTELQQLNVKARYEVFENRKQEESQQLLDRQERTVKRGATILSKLAKFKAKGMDIGNTDGALNDVATDQLSDEEDDDELNADGEDIDLIRAKEAQRERPVCLANMNDIKSKFESGHTLSKEEKREERKQEIQNIRSRLFMGKQARIKEMYQQAVADSEQCVRAVDKKSEVDIGDKAKCIKNRFETGELFKDDISHHTEDIAVFEQGLGKQSRSLFMEMDAKVATSPQPATPTPSTPKRHISQVSPIWPPPPKNQTFANAEDVVKCDEIVDEVKIKTADISTKFKFFETYKPSENDKKPFRITPPRDGVVKLPTPEDDEVNDINKQNGSTYVDASAKAAQKSSTTTKMLSVFRQMEEAERAQQSEDGLKPLKCFTPPADDRRRFVNRKNQSGSECSGSEEEDDDEEDESDDEPAGKIRRNVDEELEQAQAAARAKQLRAKFERWETKEIEREQNSSVQLYDGKDESQIESTKLIRAKFESLRDTPASPSRERVQVNRFV